MKKCCICDNNIRKGITLYLEEFNGGKIDAITYTFCPKDSPVAAEFFRAEVERRVPKK